MKDMLIKYIHFFVILYAVWSFSELFNQHEEKLANLNAELQGQQSLVAKTEVKLKKIAEFKKKVGNFKERVREITIQIEKVQKQLPADVNDTEVQQLVGGIAKDLKIKNPAPSPGKEEPNGFYFAKNYDFQASGTFLQFLILLEQLEKSERILNVKDFEFKKPESNERSRFQVLNAMITLESFRYNTNYKEDDGVKSIEQKFKVK